MNKYLIVFCCALISWSDFSHATSNIDFKKLHQYYLSRPTGQYGIAFEDFHWINHTSCPDPNFTGQNQEDFSPENKNFCHEIMVRIYYPISTPIKLGAPYYKPFIKNAQKTLRQIPGITEKQIEQLDELRSFSSENTPIISGKKFPVLLFSPGFGAQTQVYENFITELVSHGYIVVGINTPFTSGDIALANGHIVKFNSDQLGDQLGDINRVLQLPLQDFVYVYEKLREKHYTNPLVTAMDTEHIGAFGHSIGALVVANTAHTHTNWFEAVAALDIGIDESGASLKPFVMPFMHAISANRISGSPWPIAFELGKHGYLVGFTPNEENETYSYHLNFSDFSTLQYLPAVKIALAYLKEQGIDLLGTLGTGNGWEITHSINTYLVQFFNTYLKDTINSDFKHCKTLTKNNYLKCGPGVF